MNYEIDQTLTSAFIQSLSLSDTAYNINTTEHWPSSLNETDAMICR